MACVQDVETAVGENNAPAAAAQGTDNPDQGAGTLYLGFEAK